MKVNGRPMRTIWPAPSREAVEVIDQRALPHRLSVATLRDVASVHTAIRDMWVRGAPLIGAAAAFGMALQTNSDAGDAALAAAGERLCAARPTAVNLSWAVRRMAARLAPLAVSDRRATAWEEAERIADEDVAANAALGEHGLKLLAHLANKNPGRPLRVLTHCNAGWLATVDWGTATAPIYKARDAGIPVEVWVDETRPRNQGASLTAWELVQEGVKHTLIVDNAGGHLMQRGQVDAVIVGCDRVTARGDACNKIGTYLKALAARDNGVPFYVAMPTPTLDLERADGVEIPIEERAAQEVTHVRGRDARGETAEVQIAPDGTPAANPAFDVTPGRLITAFITERGVVPAEEKALRALKEKP